MSAYERMFLVQVYDDSGGRTDYFPTAELAWAHARRHDTASVYRCIGERYERTTTTQHEKAYGPDGSECSPPDGPRDRNTVPTP